MREDYKPLLVVTPDIFYTIHGILDDFMNHVDITNAQGERIYVPMRVIVKYIPQWKLDMAAIHFLMQ